MIFVSCIRRCLIFSFSLSILAFAGCSANLNQPSAFSPQKLKSEAAQYLQLSKNAPPSVSVEYRLRAADNCIYLGDIPAAAQILRETRVLHATEAIHKSILNTRLALLNKNIPKARALLSSTIQDLNRHNALHHPTDLYKPGRTPAPATQQHIALLLPSKGPYAAAGKIIRDGFLAAYYKREKHEADPTVTFYDTGDGQAIREAYSKALAENATFIVGPLTKFEVQIMAHMPLNIPVLALNTIAEGIPLPRNLYQFGLMPEDEVLAMVEHATAQGHKQALVLAPHGKWGQRLTNAFQETWQSHGGRVVDIRFYKPGQEADAVRALLRVKGTERRQDADMLFLAAATTESARQIKPLLNFYFADTLPVFSTSAVYSGTSMPSKDQDLNGIHFCDMPWILQHSIKTQTTHDSLERVWQSVTHSPRYFALGMDSYQLAVALGTSALLPADRLSGFTGALQVNLYKRIQRRLVCAKFEGGIPVPD